MTLWDPGLQPERTHLAWRRTALSVAAGSLIAMRVLPVTFGDAWWIAPGVLGVLAAAGIWALGEARYRQFQRRVAAGDPLSAGGGRLLLLAGFVTAVGMTGLVTVLLRG